MLGLLLVYFIGKKFYDLAGIYEKSQWGFAILGVVSYYLGASVGGMFSFIAADLLGTMPVEEMNQLVLGLIAIPFGLFSCFICYKILNKRWSSQTVAGNNADILDEEIF